MKYRHYNIYRHKNKIITYVSKNIKRLFRLSEKPLRIVFELGLLDFLIAYVIREMYNYKVLVLDTQR